MVELNIPELLCRVAHVFFGFLCVLAVLISPVLTVVGFIIFFTYELNQQWRKDDWFDEEMVEYGVGFSVGVIMLLTLNIL